MCYLGVRPRDSWEGMRFQSLFFQRPARRVISPPVRDLAGYQKQASENRPDISADRFPVSLSARAVPSGYRIMIIIINKTDYIDRLNQKIRIGTTAYTSAQLKALITEQLRLLSHTISFLKLFKSNKIIVKFHSVP